MENIELLNVKTVCKEFEIEGHKEHLKVLENIDLTVKPTNLWYHWTIRDSKFNHWEVLPSNCSNQRRAKSPWKIKYSISSQMPTSVWYSSIALFSLLTVEKNISFGPENREELSREQIKNAWVIWLKWSLEGFWKASPLASSPAAK